MKIYRTLFIADNVIAALPAEVARKLKTTLAGGRTGCCKQYWRARRGEKGWYVDFTSLYPWVNKYGLYPVGHP